MENGKDVILVADDAAIDRRIVKLLLRKDYEVEEAADGLETVRRLEANGERYAAVLLDMLMPVMNVKRCFSSSVLMTE